MSLSHRSAAFGIICLPMRIKRHLWLGFVASAILAPFVVFAAKPSDFSTAQIGEIWTELWRSGGSDFRPPEVENLSEQEAIERLTGKWTVMFGVVPDKLTIALSTNRAAEVSGQKDGKGWKKAGEWRIVSGKVVLFLEQDDLPGFIFRTEQRNVIFDPWAKTMMSELKREQ
jgi:hypothetical protein